MRYLGWASNQIIGATVSADNATTAHPVSNLQTQYVAQAWRTTGDNDVNLDIDLGSVQSIDLLALSGLNWSEGVSAAWYAGSSASPTGSQFVEILVYREFDVYALLDNPISYRYHRIRIQDSANPDGYLQMGLAWLGTGEETPLQYTPEGADPEIIINRSQMTEVGVLHSELLARQKQLILNWHGLSKTEYETIWDDLVIASNGSELPLFIIPRDDEYEGYSVQIAEHASQRSNQSRSIMLRLLECIRGIAVGS